MNQRAYSVLEIKAVDDEAREITGWATTPAPDRMQDVVEPKGAVYKLPIPLLWQHDSSQPIGHVVSAKVSEKGIEIKAQLAKVLEDGALKTRLDEAWQSIKAGLVRGLSIGFRGLETQDIQGSWGVRFVSWEWLELSAVTVPANAEASIQTIKSIDQKLRAPPGLEKPDDSPPGAPGSKATASRRFFFAQSKGKQMNLQEQIKAFEAKRAAVAAQMEETMAKAAEEGRTLDSEETEKYDDAETEVKAIDAHLARLKSMESVQSKKAAPVDGKDEKSASQSRAGSHAVIKAPKDLEKGIEFARYAMCQLAAKGNPQMALHFAKTHYGNNERIVNALALQADGGRLEALMKANVEAGSSLTAGAATWGSALVDYQNFAGDFVEFLRPQTIVGQFGVGSIPSLNRIPFNVRIGGQTTGGSAYWVGEGAPKPLTSFDFTATELRWNKIATIAVVTEELIQFSSPSAERLVRDSLAAAVIERMDIDFVDPAKGASAGVSPASITNGVTPIPSSGVDADAIRADVQALWAPFITARNPPRTAVYIMDSTTALALSMLRNPLGQIEFPGLTMNGGTFMGVPVIVSDYLPVDTSGGIVVLANARDIWLADDGQVTIDASREASLQMLDNPTNNSATATATSMVSMFQTNSVAFRAERYVNWAKRRSSGVAYLNGVRWGAS